MLKFLKLVQFIYMRWTVMEKQLDDEPGNSLKTFEKYVRWYHSVHLFLLQTVYTKHFTDIILCTNEGMHGDALDFCSNFSYRLSFISLSSSRSAICGGVRSPRAFCQLTGRVYHKLSLKNSCGDRNTDTLSDVHEYFSIL